MIHRNQLPVSYNLAFALTSTKTACFWLQEWASLKRASVGSSSASAESYAEKKAAKEAERTAYRCLQTLGPGTCTGTLLACVCYTSSGNATVFAVLLRVNRPKREPAWLKHDRQALRFFAFFQEPLSGSTTENSRKRYSIILFHLSDGTLSVLESTTDNGATCQGYLLKRHKVPRADGTGFVSLTDLKASKMHRTDQSTTISLLSA